MTLNSLQEEMCTPRQWTFPTCALCHGTNND